MTRPKIDAKRPVASFLFLGPTGVGKTETAKAIALVVAGRSDALVRIDVSEYQESHSVARLIGSPPGCVGYGEAGSLVEKVLERPERIVLFDEIEKAHPRVLDILLQILDDGHLTDGAGRVVDFSQAIVVMTSNLRPEAGAVGLRLAGGSDGNLRQALRASLRPELIGRIDAVVEFAPLSAGTLTAIARRELRSNVSALGLGPRPFEQNAETLAEIVTVAEREGSGARRVLRLLRGLVKEGVASPQRE